MTVSSVLEFEPPSARCGHCGFKATVAGSWTIEAGRLVFRADPDPLPFRGPDLHECSESRDAAEFTQIEMTERHAAGNNRVQLTPERVAALRAAAHGT